MRKINWKYTLGEVIIVVIGISIAFSLNSLKENLSNSKHKTQYLENMTLDIDKELKELNRINLEIQSKLKTIREIKPFLGSRSENRDTIVSKVFELARMVNFYPENTTYQTLINSGDMKLIDDFQLRRSIEEHYSYHKNVLQNYIRIEEIHKKHLGNFFIYELDYDKLQKGNLDFLDSKLL